MTTKKQVRFKCWQCGTPFPPYLLEQLPPETIRSIRRGVRRKRYVDFCGICTANKHLAEAKIYTALNKRQQMLHRRHLEMLNYRCQICSKRDKEEVRVYNNKKVPRRLLQRDLIALCTMCYDRNAQFIGQSA